MSTIQIRLVEPSDAYELQQLYAHQEVYADTLQLPYPSREHWVQRIAEMSAGMYSLVACIEGQIVGQLTLRTEQMPRRRHVATFGLGVHPGFYRRGVASQLLNAILMLCDNWLAVQRIELTVFVDNQAALALYRKFGFIIEGTCQRYAFRDGQYVDAYQMARLR